MPNFLRFVIVFVLLVLTARAAKTKQDVNFGFLENEDKPNLRGSDKSTDVPMDMSEVSDVSETTDPSLWPSLRLDFKVKRKSMRVLGQSSFTIFANPVVAIYTNDVLYDAVATFTQGKTRLKYALVNGTAYLETSPIHTKRKTASEAKCLGMDDAEILLMVNSIIGMVNEATANSDETEQERINCDGDLYNVVLAGTKFTLCSSPSSGFTMRGSYMDVDVSYLEERASILTPKVIGTTTCEKLIRASEVTPTGKKILTNIN